MCVILKAAIAFQEILSQKQGENNLSTKLRSFSGVFSYFSCFRIVGHGVKSIYKEYMSICLRRTFSVRPVEGALGENGVWKKSPCCALCKKKNALWLIKSKFEPFARY